MHAPTIKLEEHYQQKLQNVLNYSTDEHQKAKEAFLRHHAKGYNAPIFDALRQTEYRYLDEQGQIYLDYTGGGLYALTQLQAHMTQLSSHTFGNPHSSNPTSMLSTHLVEEARMAVYRHFNADPAEYALIFTSNASGALKLIGESYPFEANGQYLLTFDNHNSVNGIREYAQYHQAKTTYAPIILPDLRIDAESLHQCLRDAPSNSNKLFAYPAQSNFSGVQHDLNWIAIAQENGWDVLLDCAAFVPTNLLDLGCWKPDFVPLSFYKMFGYPTGIGALLARRDKLGKLRRPWFAGGTVEMVSTITPIFARASGEVAFEDGTLNYLGIPAIEIGLNHIASVDINAVHEHVQTLTAYLLDVLSNIRHSNGQPIAMLYGPTDTDDRGGTIAFNLLDPQGEFFDVRLVETLANEARISLRTGCFCNPGAGENAFNLTADDVFACSTDISSMTYARYIAALTNHTGRNITGAVRVSLGIASNFADVYHFERFLRTFVDLQSTGFIL